MKVFVINLDRRKERMAYMERQLRGLDVDYERVAGIDGKNMTPEERERAVSAFRWWCANGYLPRNGEIGCALSHRKVYSLMRERGLDMACIIEDDIELDADFCEMLETIEKSVPDVNRAMVFLLAPYLHRMNSAKSGISFRKVSWAASSGGYVVTLEAAVRMRMINTPLQSTADDWGRWSGKCGIELYNADPVVCHQKPYGDVPDDPAFASDTLDSGVKFVKDMPPVRKAIHKAGRIAGRLIDKLIF